MEIDDAIVEWPPLAEKLEKEFGYPRTLAKACFDPFVYAAKLKSGEILEFEFAEVVSEKFVVLKNSNDERGLEVRVSEIEMIADHPSKYQTVWLF